MIGRTLLAAGRNYQAAAAILLMATDAVEGRLRVFATEADDCVRSTTLLVLVLERRRRRIARQQFGRWPAPAPHQLRGGV